MTRATESLARVALSLFAAIAVLSPPAVAAAPAPTVKVVRAAPLPHGQPLRVDGRPPAPRFRGDAAASSVKVADPSALGIRANGKIVAMQRGYSYSCSGTAINTPSRSIVLTAGHCAMEAGRRGRRIAFVPAYDHGRRPFGTFRVKAVFVMPQWRRDENPAFDVAALRVRPSKLGRLVDVVGARGYATNRSRQAAFQIFGYPAARAGGEELRSCRAHGLGVDRFTERFFGPRPVPASCDMAAGASGGGWLFGGRYVSGVTSYSYRGRPTQLFSPYFGREVGAFLRALP